MKINELLTESSFKGQKIDPQAREWPVFKTKNPSVIQFRDKILSQYKDAKFYEPRIVIPKDGSWHVAAVVNGVVVDEIMGNAFKDLANKTNLNFQKKNNVNTEENLDERGQFDPNTGLPVRRKDPNDISVFIRAFKKIDSGAEPVSDAEWAVKLMIDGVTPKNQADLVGYKVPAGRTANIFNLLKQAPGIEEIERAIRDKEVTAQQQQQSDQLGALQHNLNVQQLIRQNQLADADAEAMLKMDVEARQAIKERMQAMELESKERLAKVEIDIRNSKEPEAERAQALEMAKQTHAHELEVIKVTAEGEYKKAKLEADYQIKIKELENIDNAGERQNRLDVINTEKQKELAIIDKETNAAIAKMRAGSEINREESDTRIREEFMMTFKPVWGSLIEKASQVGKTVGQNISAVMGALGRLAAPVMPKAQSKESISYYKNLIDEIQNRK